MLTKYLKIIYHYGFSPFKLKFFLDEQIEKWMKIYEMTEFGYKKPFKTPLELI